MNKIGDVIAGYRLDELIGEGGMGVVWAATQLSLDRTVALKVVRSELAADAEFRDRFVTESRIAASLEDPNVVSVYDAGEEGEVLFLAMAFVAGTDLRSLLRERGRLDPQSAVAVISQVASGLKAVHNAGLVHRDVKPANVLIRARDGEALLTDFGLARAVNASKVTRTGMLIGTLDYMAPEQIEGKRIDGRSDVYSLGAVLYEALTGNPPFTRETIAAQMHAHLNDPPPRPSQHDPSLKRFDSVVASALSKDPAKRPDGPAAFAQATRTALGEDAPATEAFRTAVTEVSATSAQTRVHRRRPGAAHRDLRTDEDARTRTTGAARSSKPLVWLIGGLVSIAGLALAGLIAVTLLTGSSTGSGATKSEAAVATVAQNPAYCPSASSDKAEVIRLPDTNGCDLMTKLALKSVAKGFVRESGFACKWGGAAAPPELIDGKTYYPGSCSPLDNPDDLIWFGGRSLAPPRVYVGSSYKPTLRWCPTNRTCLTKIKWTTYTSTKAVGVGRGSDCGGGGIGGCRSYPKLTVVLTSPASMCGRTQFSKLRMFGRTFTPGVPPICSVYYAP